MSPPDQLRQRAQVRQAFWPNLSAGVAAMGAGHKAVLQVIKMLLVLHWVVGAAMAAMAMTPVSIRVALSPRRVITLAVLLLNLLVAAAVMVGLALRKHHQHPVAQPMVLSPLSEQV